MLIRQIDPKARHTFKRGLTAFVALTFIPAVVGMASLNAQPSAGSGMSDEALIRETFSAYKRALETRDGVAAVELVTPSSIAYYNAMREHALFSTREELQGLEVFDQVQALLFRVRLPADSLDMLNALGTFTLGIERGWIDQGSNGQLGLGTVSIHRDEALSTAIQGEAETPMQLFRFVRVSGQWRQDLVHTIRVAGSMLNEAQALTETDGAEFVATILQYKGYEIGPEAWEPLRERPRSTR